MADEDVLANLRRYQSWPAWLDDLAVRGAAIGRLGEANARAEALRNQDLVSSSHSKVRISPARMPISEYRDLPNRLATFYYHLGRELRRVLGLPINLASHDDAEERAGSAGRAFASRRRSDRSRQRG
jgi:hypothetical protein